jgi:CheY-like chemotaxis protein
MITVLLVEDDTILLEDYAFNLEMSGYAVVQAFNGKEAIRLLTEKIFIPDIVVSDMMMPLVNGLQLLAYIRQTPQLNPIPFIFITAVNEDKPRHEAESLGINDYLIKPFNIEKLLKAIKTAVA